MTLIDYLIKNGWVAGCNVATYQEPDTIHFLPPSAQFVNDKEMMREKLTLSAPLSSADRTEVSYDDYLAACERIGAPPRHIPGEVLTDAVKRIPVSPHLPPISRIYWGASVHLLPSIQVIVVIGNVLGAPQFSKGYYSHAESRWIIGYDWVGDGKILEWWPLPEVGTGTKPPQK